MDLKIVFWLVFGLGFLCFLYSFQSVRNSNPRKVARYSPLVVIGSGCATVWAGFHLLDQYVFIPFIKPIHLVALILLQTLIKKIVNWRSKRKKHR